MNLLNKINKQTIKKYLILFSIFLATILLTLYLCDCYKVYNESKKEIPVIRGTLSEITSKELEHYLMENPTTIIYMCTSSNDVCRSYEKDLIKLVKKYDLTEKIIYLNLSQENQADFIEMFNSKYDYKIDLTTNYPAFVVFENGEITGMLQEKTKKLTIGKTKQFIEINNLGE